MQPHRTSAPPAPPIASTARVVVLTRRGCCLCEQAQQVAERVCGALEQSLAFYDVDQDPPLRATWNDHVPVTFVKGALHEMWTLDEVRLRAALVSPDATA